MADAFWLTSDQAGELVGVPQNVLRDWHKSGILVPDMTWERGRGQRRMYSFQDLVVLRLIARLRGKAPTDELRKVQPWVREHQPSSLNPPLVDWDRYAV